MDVNYCISTPNVNNQYELMPLTLTKPVKSVGKINHMNDLHMKYV